MQAKFFIALATLVVVALVAVLGSRAEAEPSYVDRMIAQTSTRLEYTLPDVVPAVAREAAVATARARLVAPPTAVVHSARLARYSDLEDKGVLVWVIDIEGIQMEAIGGAVPRDGVAEQRPILTRAIAFVSATRPGQLYAMLASNVSK